MSLITAITNLIIGPVGKNMNNDKGDVLNIKQKLHKAGYFDNLKKSPEPHGFITRELDDAIRNFQKDYDLKQDGVLLPHGETESKLTSLLRKIEDEIEKKELPAQPNNKKLIPGTNIPDESIWEDETPKNNPFDLKPNKQAIPLLQVTPPKRDIDPTMELPYDPTDKRFIRKYKDI